MLSLKELLFTELKDNNYIREPDWYIEYKNDLMEFLENAYIDKIFGSDCYRIIIMKDKFENSTYLSFIRKFVPKNNDDSDDYRDYDKIANELKENELTDESDTSDE